MIELRTVEQGNLPCRLLSFSNDLRGWPKGRPPKLSKAATTRGYALILMLVIQSRFIRDVKGESKIHANDYRLPELQRTYSHFEDLGDVFFMAGEAHITTIVQVDDAVSKHNELVRRMDQAQIEMLKKIPNQEALNASFSLLHEKLFVAEDNLDLLCELIGCREYPIRSTLNDDPFDEIIKQFASWGNLRRGVFQTRNSPDDQDRTNAEQLISSEQGYTDHQVRDQYRRKRSQRSRRNVLNSILGSVAVGVAFSNKVAIRDLRDELYDNRDSIQKIVTYIEEEQRSLQAIEFFSKEITKQIQEHQNWQTEQQIHNSFLLTVIILDDYCDLIQEYSTEVTRLLITGRLDPHYFPIEVIKHALGEIKDQARSRGLTVPHEAIAELIERKVSYVHMDKRVYVFITIPLATSKPMSAHRMLDVPLIIDDQVAVSLASQQKILVRSKYEENEEYLELRETEFDECEKHQHFHMCSNRPVFRNQNDSCLLALYDGDSKVTSKLCAFRPIVTEREVVVKITDRSVLIIVPPSKETPLIIVISCPETGKSSTFHLTEHSYLKVDYGCTLITDSTRFSPVLPRTTTLAYQARELPRIYDLELKLFADADMPTLNYPEPLHLNHSLTLVPRKTRRRNETAMIVLFITTAVIISVLSAIAVLVVCTYIKRRKIAALAFRLLVPKQHKKRRMQDDDTESAQELPDLDDVHKLGAAGASWIIERFLNGPEHRQNEPRPPTPGSRAVDETENKAEEARRWPETAAQRRPKPPHPGPKPRVSITGQLTRKEAYIKETPRDGNDDSAKKPESGEGGADRVRLHTRQRDEAETVGDDAVLSARGGVVGRDLRRLPGDVCDRGGTPFLSSVPMAQPSARDDTRDARGCKERRALLLETPGEQEDNSSTLGGGGDDLGRGERKWPSPEDGSTVSGGAKSPANQGDSLWAAQYRQLEEVVRPWQRAGRRGEAYDDTESDANDFNPSAGDLRRF